MENKTKVPITETSNQPRLFARIANVLGRVAVEKPRGAVNRPPVEAFMPRYMSLMDYAGRNAALAGMDQDADSYNGLVRRVRDLDETYGLYLKGIYQPDANKYGFSKEQPKVVFQWNLSEVSQGASEDLLYVMDAVPSAEPIQYDAGNGLMRTRQEYTSSTGLSFIDVRDMVSTETPHNNFHELYVYLPAEG